MNNNQRKRGTQRLWPIRLILAATGMALGGMFAVVAKEAADAGLPWHAFGHSVAASILAIAPTITVLWDCIVKKPGARA